MTCRKRIRRIIFQHFSRQQAPQISHLSNVKIKPWTVHFGSATKNTLASCHDKPTVGSTSLSLCSRTRCTQCPHFFREKTSEGASLQAHVSSQDAILLCSQFCAGQEKSKATYCSRSLRAWRSFVIQRLHSTSEKKKSKSRLIQG